MKKKKKEHIKCRFNCTTNNIGTRKIALLFLLVILIDLTRHLQLYNGKKKKKSCVAFLLLCLLHPGVIQDVQYPNISFNLASRDISLTGGCSEGLDAFRF